MASEPGVHLHLHLHRPRRGPAAAAAAEKAAAELLAARIISTELGHTVPTGGGGSATVDCSGLVQPPAVAVGGGGDGVWWHYGRPAPSASWEYSSWWQHQLNVTAKMATPWASSSPPAPHHPTGVGAFNVKRATPAAGPASQVSRFCRGRWVIPMPPTVSFERVKDVARTVNDWVWQHGEAAGAHCTVEAVRSQPAAAAGGGGGGEPQAPMACCAPAWRERRSGAALGTAGPVGRCDGSACIECPGVHVRCYVGAAWAVRRLLPDAELLKALAPHQLGLPPPPRGKLQLQYVVTAVGHIYAG